MSKICLKVAMIFILLTILPFSSTLAYVVIKEQAIDLTTASMQSNRKITRLDSKQNLNIKIGNVKSAQRTERNREVDNVRAPSLLASSSYATFTSLTSNATTVQKGEAVSFQSLTEWLLVTKRPVQEGAIIYYDVNEIVGDEANYEGLISNYSKIAIEFEVSEPTTYGAFSLNLSQCVDLIQNYDLVFYLTDNLSAYQTDYLMQRELSHYTYQVHQGDADSPLMFVFYDHPFTVKNSDVLEANKPYYVVIDSPQPIEIQYSLDASEKDDNTLWVYENANWIEKTGLDVQFSVYTGYNITEIAVDGAGETNFVFDTSNTTGLDHRIVASYYDETNLFAVSSDFCDLRVIDLNAPAEISLVAPNTVQYTDDAELIATVKNLYATPIANVSVMFYHSFDNSTWTLDAERTTDQNGVAVYYYNVNQSSGVVYFKAVSGDVVGFDTTTCEKEVAVIIAPEVVATYGSKTGSATESYFQIFVQVKDDDGTPIPNVLVSFNMAGQTVPYYSFTNATGWAETGQGVLDWDTGLYTSAYWVDASLDANLYVNPGTTYGDIRIVPSTLELADTSPAQIIWNEGGTVEKQFVDAEGDPIPNLSVSVSVLDTQSQNSTSLGIFTTNSSGFVSFTIPAYMFGPGNYEIHFVPDSVNYESYEGVIELTVEPDKQQLTVLPSQEDNYTYGSTLHIDIQVTDHVGTALSNVGVWIYVSYANAPFAWEVYYYYYTNDTGWVSIDLALDRQAGDIFNILITTDDYAVNGVVYSTKADAVVLDYQCVAAPLAIEGLQDINTTNQATVTIEGYIMSDGEPVANYSVEISILDTVYWVNTDSNGHFQLAYFVPQGGNIVVDIIANSTTNYENVASSLTIYADPCEITIDTADILYTGEGELVFQAAVTSSFNTSLEGVEVRFWWYDGVAWNLLGSSLTDVEGNALLSVNDTLPLGDYQWKASVATTESWLGGEAIKQLQIGLHTTTTIEVDAQTVEYSDTLTITITVIDQNSDPVSIEVKIYLNEALIASVATNSSGIAVITWEASVLPEIYTISAQTSAWNYYQESSASTNVTVTKAPSTLSTTGDIAIYYNDSMTIEAYLYTKNGALIGETIEISVDSNLIDGIITNSSGWAAWQVPNYNPGTYLVVLAFQGNSYYLGCNVSITLRVEKIQTNLDVNAPNSDYTPTYEITGQVYDAYQQPLSAVTVELFINDSVAATTTTNQQGQFVFVQDLLPGDYKITVVVNATEFIENAEIINYVHIWKLQSDISGDVTTTATTMNITGTLTANSLPLEGLTVSIFINDSWVADVITDAIGYFELFIDNITPAVYNVELIYAGDQIYESSSQTIVVEQDKLQTEMSISVNHGVYGTQAAQLIIYLSSKQEPLPNEILTIEYANKTYTVLTNTSGYAVFLFDTFIDAGTYSVQVIFDGTVIYSSNTQWCSVQIYKASSQISAEIDYSNNTITGLLSGLEALNNETITITVNGSVYGTTITGVDGSFAYSLDLAPGNYEVKLLFEGNSNYLACENSLFVSIAKNTVIITAPDQIEAIYGEEMAINITVETISSEPVIDNLTVIIDGAAYGSIATNSTGIAVLVLQSLEPGNHTIIIEMQGNEYYLYASHTIIVTVKCEPEISNVIVQAGNYGMEVNVSGAISGAVSSYDLIKLKAIVNNETYTIAIQSDGTWELVIPANFPAGTFDLELIIESTDYVLSAYYRVSFTRAPAMLNIELEPINKTFNDVSDVSGRVMFNETPVANVSLQIYIDDNLVLETHASIEGTFTLPCTIFSLKPGTYVLKIIATSSDNNYAETSIVQNIVIEKDDVSITTNLLSIPQTGTNATLVVQVYDSHGNPLENYEISIVLEGDNLIFYTNASGEAALNFTPLHAGELSILISANETEYYNAVYYEERILVERGEVSLEISATEIYYNSSTGLMITLSTPEVTIAEANLTIVLEGVGTFYLTTDENGISKWYLWNIDAGTYNLTIQFEGSVDYLSSEMNVSLIILPQPTRLQADYESNNVTFAILDSENRFVVDQPVFISIIDAEGVSIWNTTVLSLNAIKTVIVPVELFNQGEKLYLEYSGNGNFLSSTLTIELDNSAVKQSPKSSNNSSMMIVLSLVGMVGLFGAGEAIRKFVG